MHVINPIFSYQKSFLEYFLSMKMIFVYFLLAGYSRVWQGIARQAEPDKKESTSSSRCTMLPPHHPNIKTPGKNTKIPG